MANLCSSYVILTGPNDTLKLLEKTINDLMRVNEYNNTTLEAIQEKLGFEAEGWGRSYDCGVCYCELKKNGLHIDVCTAWGPAHDYWVALCSFFKLDFRYSTEVDGEYWVVNDLDGTYFKDKYVLDIYEEIPDCPLVEADFYRFETDEQLMNYLKNIDPNKTLEEWIASFEDYEYDWGQLHIIERFEEN